MRRVIATLLIVLFCAVGLTTSAADGGGASLHAKDDGSPKPTYKEERIHGTDRVITHHDFTKQQIDALSKSITKISFPQPGGTVDKLLPFPLYLTVASFDIHAGSKTKGPYAVHVDYYSISLERVLMIRKGFYKDSNGTTFVKDEFAEVIHRSKVPPL